MALLHERYWRALRPLLILAGLLAGWQALVSLGELPKYLLPGPALVFERLYLSWDSLLHHAGITALEIVLGMLAGAGVGMAVALALGLLPPLRPWLVPVLVVSQAIPIFALAPLLVLWFGYGLTPKVITAGLIIFFPVATTLYDGLRRTASDWLAMAEVMGGNRWRILWHIRLPAALPALGSGLRVAAAIAPIGAVIGEWVGASAGLGHLMLQANARLQVDLMFAALFLLACMAVALFFLTDRLVRWLTRWQPDARQTS